MIFCVIKFDVKYVGVCINYIISAQSKTRINDIISVI